jgi:hypothetical protein
VSKTDYSLDCGSWCYELLDMNDLGSSDVA